MAHKNTFSVLLAVLLAVSLATSCFSFTQAQSVTKPSVPEFTLNYVDNSYDVPPETSSSTDPYTGKVTTSTNPGYQVDTRTIEIRIKNQQYSGSQHLFYNYSYKGHYEDTWKYYATGSYPRDSSGPDFIIQSTSDYTVATFSAPEKGQIDFRVQAQAGYYDETELYIILPGAPFSEYSFVGEVSGWSQPQTIAIPESSAVLAIEWMVLAVSVVIALVAVSVIFIRRRIKALALKQNGA